MSNARGPGRESKVGGRAVNRCAVAGALSRVLADTYTLYLTSHNFYWNVTGPAFTTLRAAFMEQYTELWNALDPIAERIRALGEWAPGSYASFELLTSLDDPPQDATRRGGDGADSDSGARGRGPNGTHGFSGGAERQRPADTVLAGHANRNPREVHVDAAKYGRSAGVAGRDSGIGRQLARAVITSELYPQSAPRFPVCKPAAPSR